MMSGIVVELIGLWSSSISSAIPVDVELKSFFLRWWRRKLP